MSRHIMIVGASVAGLTASIALCAELNQSCEPYRISVFESRTEEAFGDGGAISLTPVALHYLHRLGVLRELDAMGELAGIDVDEIAVLSLQSGRCLKRLTFGSGCKAHTAGCTGRRVLRRALFQAMLTLVRKHARISVHFGKRVTAICETHDAATLTFHDGASAVGGLLLGCDGVHSVVRSQLVDPGHLAEYSGVSFIQTLTGADRVRAPAHFDKTAVHLSRHGSFLATYCDRDRQAMFVAAVAHVNEFMIDKYQARAVAGKDDETVTAVQMALRHQVRSRFGNSSLPWIREWIDKTFDWSLYPVYQVRECRNWYTKCALLLGDAAHAMPPREESAAYAIEDSVLFAQIFAQGLEGKSSPPGLFQQYDEARRKQISKAFDVTRRLWQSDLDNGHFPGQSYDFISTAYLPLDADVSDDGREELNESITVPTHESMSDLSVYSLIRDFGSSLEGGAAG